MLLEDWLLLGPGDGSVLWFPEQTVLHDQIPQCGTVIRTNEMQSLLGTTGVLNHQIECCPESLLPTPIAFLR